MRMALYAPVICAALMISGCSSDDSTGGTTPPNASTADSGTSTADSGGGTPSTPLNGCTTYADKTAGGATITWDFSSLPPTTCLRVKKGGTVTFNGNFTVHPLIAKGGSSPTPFAGSPSGTTATLTFAATGTYGFVCAAHSTMTGAIEVVD